MKISRTISVDYEKYKEFVEICKKRGITPSLYIQQQISKCIEKEKENKTK